MKGGSLGVKALVRSLVLLGLISGLGFVAVKMRGKPAADTAPDPPHQPIPDGKLYFEQTIREVAVAADATHAVVDFPFENRTGKALTISRVEKNCTCAEMQISDGKLRYAPGEKGVIRARYELGNFIGIVDKPFMLWLEGDPEAKPSHTLTARLIIPVLVELSEKTLKWVVGGPPSPAKIDIRTTSQPIRMLTASSTSEAVQVELKPVTDGRHYELWVTPVDIQNPSLALIRIETDSSIPRWKMLQVFALVQSPSTGPKPASPP